MELINKNMLMLRIHVGDVEDDDDIKSFSVLTDYSPIVEFKDGSMVAFPWQYLCEKAVEFKKQQQDEL